MECKVGLHTYLPFIYFLKNVNRTVIDQPVRFFFTINVMLSGLRITLERRASSRTRKGRSRFLNVRIVLFRKSTSIFGPMLYLHS